MKNKNYNKAVFITVIVATIIFAFDLTSKYLIEYFLPNIGDSVSFIPGFINIVIVHNDGAAWNSFSGMQILLIIASILILLGLISFYILQIKKYGNQVSKSLSVAVAFIAGGCLGNLYDRLFFGYVRDFLNFEFINFPVFNIADMFLTFGMIIFVIYFLFLHGKNDKNQQIKDKK